MKCRVVKIASNRKGKKKKWAYRKVIVNNWTLKCFNKYSENGQLMELEVATIFKEKKWPIFFLFVMET